MVLYNSYNIRKFHEFVYDLSCLEKFLREYLSLTEVSSKKLDESKKNKDKDEEIEIDKNDNLDEIIKYTMQRILSLIESFSKEESSEGKSVNNRLNYILATFSDEKFLEIDKVIYDIWIENLIEFQLFATRQGGENLYKDINRLLSENKTYHPDLAYIYLSVLCLGYKGKYRNSIHIDILDNLKKELFLYAFKDKINDIDDHLILKINNIENILPEKNYIGKSLPERKKRYKYIFYGFIIYLVLTYLLFILITYPLNDRLSKYNSLVTSFLGNYE